MRLKGDKVGIKKKQFAESAMLNNAQYMLYFNLLKSIAISQFQWSNLPDTVDERYLELTLFDTGKGLWFNDDCLGYIVAPFSGNGKIGAYGNPEKREAYTNNYHVTKSYKESVIIYNDVLKNNTYDIVKIYARRLADLDRTIDVNCSAQKTPILIVCDELQLLTLQNLFKDYIGNMPVIFGDKALNFSDAVKVIKTEAPYVSDKLYYLKSQIWREALTFLGVQNVNDQKKERMNVDEVDASNGAISAITNTRLLTRQTAVKKINEMFNLNVQVQTRCINE